MNETSVDDNVGVMSNEKVSVSDTFGRPQRFMVFVEKTPEGNLVPKIFERKRTGERYVRGAWRKNGYGCAWWK